MENFRHKSFLARRVKIIFSFCLLLACHDKTNTENSNKPETSQIIADDTINENKAYRNINFGISKERYNEEQNKLLAGNNYEYIGQYALKLKPHFTNNNELYSLDLTVVKEEKPKLVDEFTEDDGEFQSYEYIRTLLFEKYEKYKRENNALNNTHDNNERSLTFQIGKKQISLRRHPVPNWDLGEPDRDDKRKSFNYLYTISLSFTDTQLEIKYNKYFLELDSLRQSEVAKERKLEREKL